MPGVVIESWRGRGGIPQCHRCQKFGHTSSKCYRTPKCVQCGGDHIVADCPRPRDERPVCGNCGRDHTANHRRYPVLLREARKRRVKVPPPPPQKPSTQAEDRPRKPTRAERRRAQASLPPGQGHDIFRNSEPRLGTNLMAPANQPTERGAPLRKKHRGGRRYKNKNHPGDVAAVALIIYIFR